MPTLKEGEVFEPEKYPSLFKTLRASARAILKGEQARTGKKSKLDADRLTDQLVRWAVGLPPFHQRAYTTASDSTLEYWKDLRRDSNADVLAVNSYFSLTSLGSLTLFSDGCDHYILYYAVRAL